MTAPWFTLPHNLMTPSTSTFGDELIALLSSCRDLPEETVDRLAVAIRSGAVSEADRAVIAAALDAEARAVEGDIVALAAAAEQDRAAADVAAAEAQPERESIVANALAAMSAEATDAVDAVHRADRTIEQAIEGEARGEDDAEAEAIRAALKKPGSQA